MHPTGWFSHCLTPTLLAHDGNNSTNIWDFNIILSKGNNSKIGDNRDKKKMRVIYFFMSNQNMIFQNISLHYVIHNKATILNDQKLRRAITPFHLIGSKFNQVFSPQSQSVYQISWLWLKYFFRNLADKVKMPRTIKGHNYVNFSWNSLKK